MIMLSPSITQALPIRVYIHVGGIYAIMRGALDPVHQDAHIPEFQDSF